MVVKRSARPPSTHQSESAERSSVAVRSRAPLAVDAGHHDVAAVRLVAGPRLAQPGQPLAVGRGAGRAVPARRGGEGPGRAAGQRDGQQVGVGGDRLHRVGHGGDVDGGAVGRDGHVVDAAAVGRRHVAVAGREVGDRAAVERHEQQVDALAGAPLAPVAEEEPVGGVGLPGRRRVGLLVAGQVGAAGRIDLGQHQQRLPVGGPAVTGRAAGHRRRLHRRAAIERDDQQRRTPCRRAAPPPPGGRRRARSARRWSARCRSRAAVGSPPAAGTSQTVEVRPEPSALGRDTVKATWAPSGESEGSPTRSMASRSSTVMGWMGAAAVSASSEQRGVEHLVLRRGRGRVRPRENGRGPARAGPAPRKSRLVAGERLGLGLDLHPGLADHLVVQLHRHLEVAHAS